jgi:MinD-like ATPase involved in chromosome partitioning or flagellar assembly
LKVHLVYEEEYVEQLKEILEDIGHTVVEWDYSLSQFADFSEKKQTSAEVAIVDGQAGVVERREVIETLTRVRKNLPNLRVIVNLPPALEKDEVFIAKLLTLGIYDMHFKEEYDIDELESWLKKTKTYADYNIETKDVKGNVGERPKMQMAEARAERRQIVHREYRAFAAKIIIVTGVKGGVGKTDISINLAAALKKHIGNARVCVLDFDFPYGGLSRALGICPDCHLGDWITESRVLTEEGVRSRVTRHEGLDFIPMAIKIKDSLEFQQKQAETMLDALRRYYDVIVVDTSNFTEPALTALTISSEIIFICTHDIVSISVTHAYKEDLINIYGVSPEKMSLYLNMVPAHEDISKEKIAELFEDGENSIPIIGYAPFNDIVRQHRNRQVIHYNEMPSSSFSTGINMILKSIGLEPGEAINPVDNFKDKMGGVFDMLKKLKKAKEG